MKYLLLFIVSFSFVSCLFSQDSITIQTFTWDNNSRRGVFQFPDDPSQTYRKILMYYNMRCHGARVGVGSVGCYEWDYSCNTFITDSTKLDSSVSTIGNYVISGFNGLQFYYTTIPTNTFYRLIQKDATYTAIVSEQKRMIGNGTKVQALETKDGSFRSQYLFTAQELLNAGAKAGTLTGIDLQVANIGNKLPHLRIRIKAVAKSTLSENVPDVEGFTEVYYKDTEFKIVGLNRLQFYNPFTWNGSSSILVDLSYTEFNQVNPPKFLFHDAGSNQFSISASGKEQSIVWDGVGATSTASKLMNISNELTLSFWSFGTAHLQPSNGSILEGLDNKGQRALNIHLPWSNGGIYFDCGSKNGSYDRIEKTATVSDYESQWIHWTFTKNALTGEMKIYRNGELWQSGIAKFNPIQLSSLTIGAPASYQGPFYGRMRELSVWNKVLDSTTINLWKNKTIQASHPAYASLVYYYDFQDANPAIINDKSKDPDNLLLPTPLIRHQERGDKSMLNFTASNDRPNISFIQGVYSGSKITNINVQDSIPNGPRKVLQYKVVQNNLILDSVFYIYAAADDNIRFENGDIAESNFIEPEDLLEISNLKYFNKTPAKFELLSLVTPYGNNLDLGKDGKTFVFDVTDFTPILKGNKLISMELGGENQEEIDLKFVFIKGTPERNVIDISNIWTFQRGYFSEILNNSRFEPRKILLNPASKNYKLRFSITGHEQNGEFTPRNHFVTVNGNSNKKFPFTVWKECAWNPIYPQGGTWIFDRAGWCPGAPSQLTSFDITSLSAPGNEVLIDYGLEPPQLDQANYLVSSQIVAYGDLNHKLDASLQEIIRPSSGRVEFDRLNPSCNSPTVLVRNSGSDLISNLKLVYGIKNGIKETYIWNGTLNSLQEIQIELPVQNINFWNPGLDSLFVFEVEITEINSIQDADILNNKKVTPFKMVDRYAVNLFFDFKTNNIPQDNDYKIVNSQGVTVLERSNMAINTSYRDELLLPAGCYTLYVNDASHDGLYFWFYAGNGNGNARMMRKVNNVVLPIKNFNSDFGAGFQYDFVVAQPVGNKQIDKASLLSISPNPTSSNVQIEFQNHNSDLVRLFVRTMDGKTIYENQIQPKNDFQILKWNLDQFVSGSYIIQILQGDTIYSRKLIKI
ncbi:MAG: T9SS type A sorting domain-containing protein [Saprospiraceae bacterium]|nr:T9SS type A sorting domain-containing protein [Saprospiraceae bacterium]